MSYGLTVAQSLHVRIDVGRSVRGTFHSELWVDHQHERIKWSRFALMWSGIAAQASLDLERQ